MTVTRIPKSETQNVEHSAFVAVRCPVCRRGKLLDAEKDTDMSTLHLFGIGQKGCQWYIKCPKCGNQIGVSFGKAGKRPLRKPLLH